MTAPPLPPEVRRLIDAVVDATGLELPERHEVARELEAHFEDGLDAGVGADELIRRFGDPGRAAQRIARARRERTRGIQEHDGRWWMRGGEWIRSVKQSARALGRAPGYSLLVVVTLALGVGANTAVFTVLDAVLLAPLPYHQPDRLVRVYESEYTDPGGVNFVRGPTMAALHGWDGIFDGVGAIYTYRETGADLTDGDRPVRVTVLRAAAGYFETLGVSPVLGRTFVDDESFGPGEAGDTRDAATRVTVLSHHLWRTQFGADPDIVGRTVRMDDTAYEVVGVMPAGFDDPFGPAADAWVPQDLRPGGGNSWGNFYLSGVARLRDGVTLEAAQEQVDARFAALTEAEGIENVSWGPRLVPLHDDVVGDTRRAMLWLLAGAAGLVLLSACVNVANLVFARGLGRSRDTALRSALGSGRVRLVVGALTEGALLALAGGALGSAVGWLGVQVLLAVAPDALPLVTTPSFSPRIFAFGFGTAIVALLVFGLTPALRFASTPPGDALRQGQRGSTGGGGLRRLRDALVVVQVAAGLVLLAGAGLLTRSFLSLQDVPLAVEPAGVLTFEVHLPAARYPHGAARQALHDELHRRVSALPSVEAAGAVSWLPVNGRYNTWGFNWTPRGPEDRDDAWYNTDVRIVQGRYFDAMGIDVVRGQGLDTFDPAADSVVWVNQALVDQVFGDEEPVGQIVWVANAERRVAGVVESVPFDTRGAATRITYVPHAQHADDRNWALFQAVRTRGDLAAVQADVQEILASLDGQLVLYKPRPFEAVLATGRARDRFATVLMGAFAMLALVLTLVGTYGVLAHAVAGRRREIGIRMALGADDRSVRGMVLHDAATLAVPGIVLGLAAAWYGSRWIESLLFQVGALDPAVYGGTAVLVAVACLLAGWVPARRATRVDPARTLTAE